MHRHQIARHAKIVLVTPESVVTILATRELGSMVVDESHILTEMWRPKRGRQQRCPADR
jgi:hypothetical protein